MAVQFLVIKLTIIVDNNRDNNSNDNDLGADRIYVQINRRAFGFSQFLPHILTIFSYRGNKMLNFNKFA